MNLYLDENTESTEKLMNTLKFLNDHSQKFFVPISKTSPPMAVFVLNPEKHETQRVERREAEKQLKVTSVLDSYYI